MKQKKKQETRKQAAKSLLKYRSYHELHWVDKSLDKALLAGVVIGLFLTAVELITPGQMELKGVIVTVDVLLLGIFMADSGRNFVKSKNLQQYLKKHWLDIVLLVVFLLSLSSVLFFGLGRLRWLIREEKVIGNTGRFLSITYIRRLFK